MSSRPILQSVSHEYEGHSVLTDISLSMRDGEFVAIVGPSGCGKSTLLRMIAGLIKPQQGRVCIAQQKVGLVFQDYALFPHKTVYENIAFGLEMRKQPVKKRVEELLHLIGMTALAQHKPHELSGGQQQRVALARALAPKPALLLLDEPFANIDTSLKQTLSEALQRLSQQEHVSVLFVTHDWADAFALADRIAILQPSPQGSHIVQYDTPQHIYQRPVNGYVATLFGATALLPDPKHGGYAVIRPDMVTFKADPHGTAWIIARQFQGKNYQLVCQTSLGKIFAEITTDTAPAIGTKGNITIAKPNWWVCKTP